MEPNLTVNVHVLVVPPETPPLPNAQTVYNRHLYTYKAPQGTCWDGIWDLLIAHDYVDSFDGILSENFTRCPTCNPQRIYIQEQKRCQGSEVPRIGSTASPLLVVVYHVPCVVVDVIRQNEPKRYLIPCLPTTSADSVLKRCRAPLDGNEFIANDFAVQMCSCTNAGPTIVHDIDISPKVEIDNDRVPGSLWWSVAHYITVRVPRVCRVRVQFEPVAAAYIRCMFWDGSTKIGRTQSCFYLNAGTYLLQLIATDESARTVISADVQTKGRLLVEYPQCSKQTTCTLAVDPPLAERPAGRAPATAEGRTGYPWETKWQCDTCGAIPPYNTSGGRELDRPCTCNPHAKWQWIKSMRPLLLLLTSGF